MWRNVWPYPCIPVDGGDGVRGRELAEVGDLARARIPQVHAIAQSDR
jgi:hypothetical protein